MVELPTPLEAVPPGLAPGEVFLKREDFHELGAFKWRGALATLERYAAAGAASVVTASTGNHGAATAWASKRLGLRAVVYAPREASRSKTALIASLGAQLCLFGEDLDEAKELGRAWAEQQGLPFFEDGAEPAQLEGYGAIGDEILDQLPVDPAAIVVPVGNGALLGGIGLRVRARSPGTAIVGVVAAAAPVMARSLESGSAVAGLPSATFADGLAVRVAIPFALEVLEPVVDRVVEVSERELADAVGDLARTGIRVEGAGAAALAGLRRLGELGRPVVCLLTGRNIDAELHARAVERPESFPG